METQFELETRRWREIRDAASREDRGFRTPCLIPAQKARARGYVYVWVGGRTVPAHRLAVAQREGVPVNELPAGRVVDHLCDVRACCAPEHLDLTSQRANILRGRSLQAQNAARLRCPRGHALTGENLVPARLRRGGRECLLCDRASTRVSNTRRLGRPEDFETALAWIEAKYHDLAAQAKAFDPDVDRPLTPAAFRFPGFTRSAVYRPPAPGRYFTHTTGLEGQAP